METLSKTILKERKLLDIFDIESCKSPTRKGQMQRDNKTGNVLVTKTSELVEIIINEKEDINFLITIDSENLLRAWSVKTSSTTYSYKIPMKKRITAVAIDPSF